MIQTELVAFAPLACQHGKPLDGFSGCERIGMQAVALSYLLWLLLALACLSPLVSLAVSAHYVDFSLQLVRQQSTHLQT